MTASAFDINIIPVSGQQLIAAATAANRIVILGARSKSTSATDADDLASKDVAWFDGATGEILSCSADNVTARILLRFAGSDTAGAQTLASVCLLAKLANADDSTAVILSASSDTTGKITIPGSSIQFVKIPINISFSQTSVVQIVEASAAAPSDLLRFVSCHKAGDAESGENQDIWGDKTFQSRVDFNSDIHVNSPAVFNDTVEMYSDIYIDGDTNLAQGATINSLVVSRDATVNGVLLSGNIEPVQSSAKDIGARANKWRYLFCEFCIPEYLGLTSNRVPNAFIINTFCTNLTISGTLAATAASNAKNILVDASMSGGSLTVTRLDNGTANLGIYNSIGGTAISGSTATVPVGSLVLAYIPLQAGSNMLHPGSTIHVISGMACHIAVPVVSLGSAPYADTGVPVPIGYYRLIEGAYTSDDYAGGYSHYPVLLQRIAESDAD